MPSGTTKRKRGADTTPDEPAEAVTPATVAEETPTVSGSRKRRSTQPPDRPKRRPQALPVLVVDETVLLPHMSIPFPIEDEEAALVIDRASRMPNRQILVLTERP